MKRWLMSEIQTSKRKTKEGRKCEDPEEITQIQFIKQEAVRRRKPTMHRTKEGRENMCDEYRTTGCSMNHTTRLYKNRALVHCINKMHRRTSTHIQWHSHVCGQIRHTLTFGGRSGCSYVKHVRMGRVWRALIKFTSLQKTTTLANLIHNKLQ